MMEQLTPQELMAALSRCVESERVDKVVVAVNDAVSRVEATRAETIMTLAALLAEACYQAAVPVDGMVFLIQEVRAKLEIAPR